MTCRQVRRLLSVRREWTEREQATAAQHLNTCPTCQAVAREYELMDRRLGRLPEAAPVMALPDGIQVRTIIKGQSAKGSSPTWRWQAIQAGVLLVLLVAVALVWSGQSLVPASEPGGLPIGPKGTAPELAEDLKAAPALAKSPKTVGPESFIWPVAGAVTQVYWAGHQALDIANRVGTPVYAAAGGIVVLTQRDDDLGLHVLIDHGGGYETLYAHLQAIYVAEGEVVERRQQIGEVGGTGFTTGPHLHFEIRKDGERLNPLALLPGERLPGEHTPQEEAGVVPTEARDLAEGEASPDTVIPTPGPGAPTRIVIPAIGVDAPIVEGDSWERLKLGVGHHLNTANPGEGGNMVLSAHNDIYGEIFRYLGDLELGDEVIIYAGEQPYRYVVKEKRIVEPTELGVLAPTTGPVATLITCYPYLVDTHRVVVVAELQ